MKEVEILFKINEKKAQKLREKLNDFFIGKIREIDTYFYPPHRDFLLGNSGRENLRVRNTSQKNELTYKKVIYKKGKYSHSIEKNVNISNAEKTIEILETLGFRTHLIVNKQREIFEDQNFHITIDNVKNLGIFVEVEWKGHAKNEEKAMEDCLKKACELRLKEVQDKGYLRLLEEKNDR